MTPQTRYKVIGTPMPVIEDRRFVRGRGRYINDLAMPAMLHIAVVPAMVAHARLLSVDTSEALAAAGVVAVLTGADLVDDDGSGAAGAGGTRNRLVPIGRRQDPLRRRVGRGGRRHLDGQPPRMQPSWWTSTTTNWNRW